MKRSRRVIACIIQCLTGGPAHLFSPPLSLRYFYADLRRRFVQIRHIRPFCKATSGFRGFRHGLIVRLLRKVVGSPRMLQCLPRLFVSGQVVALFVVRRGAKVSMRCKIVQFGGFLM